jgi:serine/threonine protein kinase/tetratricopeptide (TPR) repeat protein
MAVFDRAAEIGDRAEREAYLAAACAGAPDVRRKVDALLRADARAGSFLDRPAVPPMDPAVVVPASGEPPDAAGRPPGAEVGTVLAGKYALLRELGGGGMGKVFLADQTHPVRRPVAVKVIKAGMDSDRVLARFEAERQALALMDHPHIARVLDAGVTEAGRPFFVMELVRGVPLTEFCDAHQLSIPDRLSLFIQICAAVQHAHQKGVIHRDLKPSNILVESPDGKPVPKVIDFGLAKATGGLQLTEHTLFTALGAVAGTPLYMAPEQAAFNAIDVDTRADVYALGVVLYELLTGTTPIERDALKAAAFDDVLRVIREQDPPAPSSRLSTSESKASVAAVRQTQAARLGRFVRGELDWIVMKALAKERDRRYESATAFARDVERFLNREPVQAAPPRAGYKVRKFVRRNKGLLSASAVVVVALVVGTGVSIWQAVRARRAEQAAESSLGAVTLQKQRADREAAVAQAVSKFLGDLLAQANPNTEPDRDLKLRTVLDRAAQRIEGQFGDEPLVEAKIRMTIGGTYRGLGLSAVAEPHLERARKLYDRELGPDDRQTLAAMNNLAAVYQDQGKFDQAAPLKEEVYRRRLAQFGPLDADTLLAMNNLADLYRIRGQYELAADMFRQVIAGRREASGPTHPETLRALSNLAGCYCAERKYDLAEPILKEVKETFVRHWAATDPLTLTATHNLGWVYREGGKYDLAEAEFVTALAGRQQRLGPDAPDVAGTLADLGLTNLHQKKYVLAEGHARECVRILNNVAPDSWELFGAYSLLGGSLLGQQQYAAAEPLLLQGYQGMVQRKDSVPADEAVRLTEAVDRLVELYTALGKADEAAKWRAERARSSGPVEKAPSPREVK